jgi:hypothetical protein
MNTATYTNFLDLSNGKGLNILIKRSRFSMPPSNLISIHFLFLIILFQYTFKFYSNHNII